MNTGICSIFFHNYYGQHEQWITFFSEKVNIPFILYYNIVEDSIYNLDEDNRLLTRLNNKASGQFLKKISIRKSPNQGKDIGGKLVLLDAWLHLQLEGDYIIFLHDKKSPYKTQNEEWQKKLFRIIEPSFIKKALHLFNEGNKIGIVAGADNIKNEYDYSRQSFVSNNKTQLMNLQSEFNIVTINYSYVAGTMFWARSLPLSVFFKTHNPLDIRKTLEQGNIMDESNGSNTHAWERLLSWLIIAQGYTIKGI